MERLDWSKVSLTSYTVQNVGLSFLTRSVTYPLSLMKTRLQNQDASNRQYRGMVDCGRKIIHHEGVRGFFKGGFQIFLQLPASTLYLTTLDMSLSVLPSDMNPAGRGFVSGAAAGMVAQCYFVPLDVITQRMQIDVRSSGKVRDQVRNMDSIRRYIWRTKGLKGFYRGYRVACLNHVPQATLFWSSYGHLKTYFKNDYYSTVYATLISSLSVNLLTTPVDTIKTRFQLRDSDYYTMFKELHQKEGVRGFYKGFQIRLIIALLTNVPMTCWREYLRK